jgi:hypothetical protein
LIFGGYFWEYFSSIFGAVFEVHFCTLFGLRSVCDLLVLRDFFDVDGGFWPVFRRVLDRTFGDDFVYFSPVGGSRPYPGLA